MLTFKKEKEIDLKITSLKKITKTISLLRLIIILFLIVFIVCLISLDKYILYGLLSIITFLIFILFIAFTNKYFKQLEKYLILKECYITHIKRRNLDLFKFYDTGLDFLNKDDYKLSDLDIVGKNSLFQYLTSAKTKLGRKLLFKQLSNPDEMSKEFKNFVNSLTKTEDSITLEGAINLFKDDSKLVNYDEIEEVNKSKIEFKPLFLIPIISFICFVVSIILTFFNLKFLALDFLFLVGNFLSTFYFLRNDKFMINSSLYYNLLQNYLNLIDVMNNINIDEEYYNKTKKEMNNSYIDLKKLASVYSILSTRNNIIFRILLNSLFIYDFFLIIHFNNIVKKSANVYNVFVNTSYLELALSLANIGIDNEIYSLPNNNCNNIIEALNMYHPLVKDCISNDFTLNGGVILTGSNMSGKTTFMRTLGINQILFNAGGVVCAKYYNSCALNIYTSLRANDMLSEGISTFYAEILRMKKISEAIKNKKCLVLVDEIFKGTNAYERIEGSKIVISKLVEANVLFIISTHDFELCNSNDIINYHFNETYKDNDKIIFDYKIKRGKCESTNAMHLLKMAGII